jgi:hypothetical protein
VAGTWAWWRKIAELAQQTLLKQSLHIPATIQHTMDRNGCTIEAIENPIRLESDFSELSDTNVLQLWRDVAAKGQGAERVAGPFESLKQSIGLIDGIAQSNVPVDFKKVVFGIDIDLDVTLFHS